MDGEWELSSAGSEHLPYKQRVGGSNPSAPTKKRKAATEVAAFFIMSFRLAASPPRT